ncbi:hypothetical protein [Actinomadura kijaniata]|uniref:hypothetical protein n=1 Tax=Actinomadura kijaniata TaxID=46161 RepID=UPI00082B7857|nr:hypothetical protein [Actinomadura kijaniata]
MHEERLAEFSRERLDGRPVPDDLRTMLVAQWEGRTDLQFLLDLTFLEPGEPSPLLDTSYLSEKELADPEMQAINAGIAEMSRYAKFVAKGGKGWIGYWTHPDEPEGPPPVIELDTEFTYWTLAGGNLAEACASERARYQGEPDERIAFAQLADQLAELGLPLSTRDYDALHDPGCEVDPEKLTNELIDIERGNRGIA